MRQTDIIHVSVPCGGTISRGDSGPHCSDSKPTASRSRAYDRAGGRVERRRPHRSSAARLWPRLGLALLAHLLLRSSLEEGGRPE